MVLEDCNSDGGNGIQQSHTVTLRPSGFGTELGPHTVALYGGTDIPGLRWSPTVTPRNFGRTDQLIKLSATNLLNFILQKLQSLVSSAVERLLITVRVLFSSAWAGLGVEAFSIAATEGCLDGDRTWMINYLS